MRIIIIKYLDYKILIYIYIYMFAWILINIDDYDHDYLQLDYVKYDYL